MDIELNQFWEIVEDTGVWPAAVRGIAKSRTQLSDWTVTTTIGNDREGRKELRPGKL